MRVAVIAAILMVSVAIGSPLEAAAQPEPAPMPAPPPPPDPPAPREVAVPRSEAPPARQTAREPESQPSGRASRADEGSRARDAQPPAEQEARPRGAVRREGEAGRARGATDEQQRARGAERRGAARAEGERGRNRQAADGQQGEGAERRGAVRRPPAARPTDGSQATRDRAVPRGSVPPRQTDRVLVYPNLYRYYDRYYNPWGYGGFGLGYFYYSPWGWDPSYSGGSPYGYGYGYPGYTYSGQGYSSSRFDTGSVKLKVKPRDAEVYVDGYFAGHVDDFDGILQALKLASGAYRIEVRKPGYETLHFDVRVQADRSITFRGQLQAIP
jgi:hypothetical protein